MEINEWSRIKTTSDAGGGHTPTIKNYLFVSKEIFQIE